jgi:hypothetical protein
MQQHRTLKRAAFKGMLAKGDPEETTCALAVIACVLALLVVLTALSPHPLNLRAPMRSARCIITPISIDTVPTYLCEG